MKLWTKISDFSQQLLSLKWIVGVAVAVFLTGFVVSKKLDAYATKEDLRAHGHPEIIKIENDIDWIKKVLYIVVSGMGHNVPPPPQ